MNAVELRDGAVTRGATLIWRDATIDVATGSVSAILGPNGAGKSTLLYTLLGLVSLSEGSLHVLGRAPRRGDARVGYMPQTRREGDQHLSARDYVGLGFDGTHFGWRRTSKSAKEKAVRDALLVTGANAFASQPLRTLSGGQRQRVALAHAMVFRPDLLLLDEPLAALDIGAQAEIVDLINLIRHDTGATIIVVAHDLNPLAPIVDHVVWIARHQVRSGPIDDVVNEAVLSDLYGHPIEIIVTPRGRRVIVGLEEEFAHPHPHHQPRDHVHEEAHEHFAEFYRDQP